MTVQKNAQNRLEKELAFFSLLAENSQDMIYRMNLTEGTYEYVSPSSENIFGYTPDEFYASPFLIKQVLHPDWQDYFDCQWIKLKDGDMPPVYEYQIIHKSGETKWVNQRNVLIKDDSGTPTYIKGIVTDITERKNLETRLKSSNEELDAFVKTVAHDLRTPITPIIGYAEILRENYKEQLDEKGLHYLSEIEKAGKDMLALMEGLLSLAKSGELERPVNRVSTDEVVTGVIKNLEADISNAGVTLQSTSLPAVRLPKACLIQIFDNLIGNAVRYAGKSSNLIEVGGERIGRKVRFFVCDHGPGISEEERKHVFEIFYRGKSKEEVKGSGIGLAIVYKIARNCGGSAWVEETPGGGCTFWVEIDDETQD